MKLISVVTVVLNDANGVRKTLDSVSSQKYRAIEHIVIDGGSKDGTITEIQKYKSSITYFISEPDQGTYDAMNKGIRRATGDYILFLNAGDYFYSNESVERLITDAESADIVYGDIVFKDSSRETVYSYPDVLNFNFFVRDTLPHPCTLIRRDLFEKHGLYNADIRICADWVFFIDCIAKFGSTYKHVPFPVSVFYLGGLSSNPELVKREKEAYLKENYGFYYGDYIECSELEDYRQRIFWLRKSRIFKMILKVLPSRFNRLINS